VTAGAVVIKFNVRTALLPLIDPLTQEIISVAILSCAPPRLFSPYQSVSLCRQPLVDNGNNSDNGRFTFVDNIYTFILNSTGTPRSR
jgi:hypothetical protein